MTVIVNNYSGTNVILSVNQSNYLIKENDCDLVLTVENETTSFSLKREKSISAPPYKKMLLFEILGIVSLLFSKPSYYILDVSSTYYLKPNEECVTIDIIRKECSSGDIGIYDVIVAESIDSKLTTNNMPILTKLASWKYGFDSPFKADVYYVNTKQFINQNYLKNH